MRLYSFCLICTLRNTVPDLFSLPQDLQTAVLDCLRGSHQEFVAFCVVTAFLASKNDASSITYHLTAHGAIPRSIINDSIAIMKPGLTRFDCYVNSTFSVDDEILIALSQSTCSKTLRNLSIPIAKITDESSAAWERFEALQVVDLTLCKRITMVTVDQISQIPSIEEIMVSVRPSVSELDCIFAPNRLINLRGVKINLRDCIQSEEMTKQTLEIITSHPAAPRMEYFDGDFAYWSPFCLELHRLMPNLQSFVLEPYLSIEHEEAIQVLELCSNVRHVASGAHFIGINSSAPVAILSMLLPNLESLLLEERLFSDDEFDLSKFSQLKKLTIYPENVRSIISWPQKLQKLKCIQQPDVRGDFLSYSDSEKEAIIERLQKTTTLQKIQFESYFMIFDAASKAALESHLPDLQQFDVIVSSEHP
jgi:hypothetical protein